MHLLFQQYLERLGRREAKPHTLKNFERTAVLFGESDLDPMTAEDWQLEEWLVGLPLKPRTKRLHFENLAAAYNYAVYRRQIPFSPMEAVKLPREPDKEPRILENDELRTLLGNCITDQQHLLLHTFIYTGMRRNEVRFLKWEDVSPASIRVTAGKGDKLRHVPLHPALAEVLIQAVPRGPYVFPGRGGKPMAESTFCYQLDKVSGGVDCTFHDFRRTVATNLAEADVPSQVIDKIMGWAPRTVGSRYYIRTADHRMQEAILKLYANDPLTLTAGGR